LITQLGIRKHKKTPAYQACERLCSILLSLISTAMCRYHYTSKINTFLVTQHSAKFFDIRSYPLSGLCLAGREILTMQNFAAGKFLAPARNFTPCSARAPRGPLRQGSKNLFSLNHKNFRLSDGGTFVMPPEAAFKISIPYGDIERTRKLVNSSKFCQVERPSKFYRANRMPNAICVR